MNLYCQQYHWERNIIVTMVLPVTFAEISIFRNGQKLETLYGLKILQPQSVVIFSWWFVESSGVIQSGKHILQITTKMTAVHQYFIVDQLIACTSGSIYNEINYNTKYIFYND